MTKFRNFVVSCALAAASVIPPVAPTQAMPRPALDIEIKASADVQSVTHRGYYPRWRHGYYGGWPGYHPGYRRAGISFYFGPGIAYRPYYPHRSYYGSRYYYGPRYYGPGYYPYRYYRPGYYGYRPYGYRYYRPGYYGGYRW